MVFEQKDFSAILSKNHLKYYYLSFSLKGSNTGLMKTTDQGPHLTWVRFYSLHESMLPGKTQALVFQWCLKYRIPSSTPDPAEGILRTTSVAFMGRWESTTQIIWKSVCHAKVTFSPEWYIGVRRGKHLRGGFLLRAPPWCYRSAEKKITSKSVLCSFRKRGAVRPCLPEKVKIKQNARLEGPHESQEKSSHQTKQSTQVK